MNIVEEIKLCRVEISNHTYFLDEVVEWTDTETTKSMASLIQQYARLDELQNELLKSYQRHAVISCNGEPQMLIVNLPEEPQEADETIHAYMALISKDYQRQAILENALTHRKPPKMLFQAGFTAIVVHEAKNTAPLQTPDKTAPDAEHTLSGNVLGYPTGKVKQVFFKG